MEAEEKISNPSTTKGSLRACEIALIASARSSSPSNCVIASRNRSPPSGVSKSDGPMRRAMRRAAMGQKRVGDGGSVKFVDPLEMIDVDQRHGEARDPLGKQSVDLALELLRVFHEPDPMSRLQIRRMRVNPPASRQVEKIPPLPVFDLDDPQIGIEGNFSRDPRFDLVVFQDIRRDGRARKAGRSRRAPRFAAPAE